MSELRILEFLRKAAILEFCLFKYVVNGIDWDRVLGNEELLERYEVMTPQSLENLENLTPFTFCDLPDRFLSFGRPPYKVDLTLPHQLFLCLLTGEILSMGECRPEPYEKLNVWLEKVMLNTFSPLLVLRGDNSSRAIYKVFGRESNALGRESNPFGREGNPFGREGNLWLGREGNPFGREGNLWFGRDPRYVNMRDVNMRDVYVDDFGESDWGMNSGRMLELSRDVLDAEVDRLLSHRWTDQCY
jgi:hypothetical protein